MSDQISTAAIRALTWDEITPVVVSAMLGEIDRLRADRDRLASLLERARQAMDEGYSCPRCGWMPDDPYPVPRWGPCDICADARDLLTEMDTPHEEGAEG